MRTPQRCGDSQRREPLRDKNQMEKGSKPMSSQFKMLAELASITPGFAPKPNERRKAGR